MEIMLDVKNIPKAMNPTKNDIILYNGKTWYFTTKEALLADVNKLLEQMKQENQEFKQKVSKQLYEMSELIKKLYEVEK